MLSEAKHLTTAIGFRALGVVARSFVVYATQDDALARLFLK